MILRIVQRAETKPAENGAEWQLLEREFILENDRFLILPSCKEDMNTANEIFISKEIIENSDLDSIWKVLFKDKIYIFELAYLMNNEGATIEKYR